ncbi:MAG: hypothetical protein Q8P82_01555 [bacterium]|nr:hypothetical protein [bacterium]
MSQARQFIEKHSDGVDMSYVCDGTHHFEYVSFVGYDDEAELVCCGTCDGACTPERRTVDLGAHRAEVQALFSGMSRWVWVKKGGRRYRRIEESAEFRALFDGEDFDGEYSVPAVLFAEGYAKRGAEWKDFCVDHRLHVHSVSHCNPAVSGDYQSHEFRTSPCDGSCEPPPIQLPDGASAKNDSA